MVGCCYWEPVARVVSASPAKAPAQEAAKAEGKVPPPPPAHTTARGNRKRRRIIRKLHDHDNPPDLSTPDSLKNTQNDDHGISDHAPLIQDAIRSQFRLQVRNESPHPLQQLHLAIVELSSYMRQYPTVPADTKCPNEPIWEVFDDSCAVVLPRKHCAFSGCKESFDDKQVNWNTCGNTC